MAKPSNLSLGQAPEFQKLSLELKTHKGAEFTADDNVFKIVLKAPEKSPVRTTYRLIQHKGGNSNDVQQSVLCMIKENDIEYRLAIPESGWYELQLFAKPLDSEGLNFPGVYTYLFEVKDVRKKVCPYPKQFADFKKGSYIHKPKYIDPSKKLDKVEFKVESADAKGMAVTAGDEWTHLQKDGKYWVGDVSLEHYRGKTVDVKLNARFGDDEKKFATLVVYNLDLSK